MNIDAESAKTAPISYSVDGASAATGIPTSTLWLYIQQGKLSAMKVGRRRLIPADALRRLVYGDSA